MEGILSVVNGLWHLIDNPTFHQWIQVLTGLIPLGTPLALLYIAQNVTKRLEQEKREREEQLEKEKGKKQKESQQQETLRNYLQQMTVLLVDKDLSGKSHDDPTSQAARALTLTAIRELDSKHNQPLTRFLDEAGLVRASPSLLRKAYLVAAHLTAANLSSADLYGADLSGTKLEGADLNSANLRGANLRGADLDSADLDSADLRGARLSSAKLNFAYLTAANLSSADFYGADLSGTKLEGADLNSADLKKIIWDEYTKWDNVRGLDKAKNVPSRLKKQLGLD